MSREEEILSLQRELDSLRELTSGDRPRLDDVIEHGSLGDKQVALGLYQQRMALLDRLGHSMNALMQHLQEDCELQASAGHFTLPQESSTRSAAANRFDADSAA